MVRDDVSGDKRLVAYVVPSPFEIFDTNEVRGALFEKLPAYMVPTSFVILDQLPLTPSGKLDRRALPAPEHSGIESEREYVAPRTEVEESLANIWTRLLKVERVGVNDNFFELGGHSVLVTRMISEVNSIYEVDVSLRVVFETPTLSSIASEIEKAIAGNTKPAEPAITPIARELRRVKPQAS